MAKTDEISITVVMAELPLEDLIADELLHQGIHPAPSVRRSGSRPLNPHNFETKALSAATASWLLDTAPISSVRLGGE